MRAMKDRISLIAILLAAMLLAACAQSAAPHTNTPDATALIQQRLPTINAQLTAYAGQINSSLPTVQANMTLVATLGSVNPNDVTVLSPSATPTIAPTVASQGGATAQPATS